MRKSPALQVEEISGDQITDLAAAQETAARCLASGFAEIFKRLQAEGLLIIESGRIVPNPERIKPNE